jgi:hypothetical protein
MTSKKTTKKTQEVPDLPPQPTASKGSELKPPSLKFYRFRQNNSGGHFHENDKVGELVIVEAISHTEANEIAEDNGIYFDGCDSGRDCSCCGDRWYKAHKYDEEEAETDPNKLLDEHRPFGNNGVVHIYFHDGRHEGFKYEFSHNDPKIKDYIFKRIFKRELIEYKNWR